MKAIEIENLSKAYPLYASKKDKFKEAVLPGNRKYHKDFYALRNVSFEVEKGECVGIIGLNGSGKSTLLNLLVPELELATGETSKKLGRGRHTTRHVELYPVEGGYVADTPGFSTMDIERYELFRKEELPEGFREFAPYLGECRFTSCSHTCEKGCAVLKAVEEGKISRSRIDSYIAMYNEVKDIKEWQLSKTKNV